ncbi:1-(5-phosphoribosyl)-5-amino-4-imidazole-carboxylate carboxylase [Clostridia bacterium]|nr:1-(5-phosphoribosyl)-5-amino-4-imidazole-carboxylate carboxylase [Clostridia bacterium]
MDNEVLLEILCGVQNGRLAPDDALLQMRKFGLGDAQGGLGYANIDYARGIRQGVAEVIYGQSKTSAQIVGILQNMTERGIKNILVTRIDEEKALEVSEKVSLRYYKEARIGVAAFCETPKRGNVLVASGGTSDIGVCEEAAVTAETLGNNVTRMYDVGVAGLSRVLSRLDVIMSARVVIAVAGMEGALASVLGGLVAVPVIAVPTSVGYGANFGGLSALLAMLNSCASGVSVVNIDNGFGAGYIANMINS